MDRNEIKWNNNNNYYYNNYCLFIYIFLMRIKIKRVNDKSMRYYEF